jgi:hypothetical protein
MRTPGLLCLSWSGSWLFFRPLRTRSPARDLPLHLGPPLPLDLIFKLAQTTCLPATLSCSALAIRACISSIVIIPCQLCVALQKRKSTRAESRARSPRSALPAPFSPSSILGAVGRGKEANTRVPQCRGRWNQQARPIGSKSRVPSTR